MTGQLLGACDGAVPLLRAHAARMGVAPLALGSRLAVVVPPSADVHVGPRHVCIVVGRPRVERLPGKEAGVSARIAAGFESRGRAILSQLRPPFTLLLWDVARDEGFVAVDQLGARTVFTAAAGSGVVFGSEVSDVLAVLPRRPAPSDAALAAYLAGRGIPPDATLHAGVARVPGGHLLALPAGGAPSSYYLPPPLAPLAGDPDHLAETVWGGVAASVAPVAGKAGGAGVLLSGGLDSCVVAAAALERRPDLLALSARFPARPEVDESDIIRSTRDALGLSGGWVEMLGGSMLRDALTFQRRWEVPSPSPTLAFQEPLARLAAVHGVALLVDGEGGDELFGLRPYLVADRLRRGRVIAAVRLSRSVGGGAALVGYGVKGAAPRSLRRLRRASVPGWLLPPHADGLRQIDERWRWRELDGPAWQQQAWDELTVGRERHEVHQYLHRRAAAAGLEAVHPFLEDLDLIELVLRLDPEPAFASELDRPFLRAAGRGRVPDRVRLRGTKSYFNALLTDALDGPDRPAIQRLLGRGAELERLVSREHLRLVVETPAARRRGSWAWAAWRLATAECWLRFQGDHDFDQTVPELVRLPAPQVRAFLDGRQAAAPGPLAPAGGR